MSGHCADGVCCNTECTGNCNTCVKSLGAEKDGTCKTVVNADVTGSCDATHGGCDGGACTCNAESACTLVNPAVSVVAGYDHTCALLQNGDVKCWGSNVYGQLGVGTQVQQLAPGSAVNLGQKATRLAAGRGYTCALLDDGSVKCWGLNTYGQLGIGNTTQQLAPGSAVNFGQKATEIAASAFHTCAVLDDGTVRCWGYNAYGQLGIGTYINQSAPQVVSLGYGKATQIIAGLYHTCAIHLGGVKCWGRNVYGQLGTGTTAAAAISAYDAKTINLGGFKPTALATGGDHSCALLSDGSVRCWGLNNFGQLGIANKVNQSTPASVVIGKTSGLLAVGNSEFYSCAVLINGSVTCWGNNESGQLGLGDATIQTNIPGNEVNVGINLTVMQASGGPDHACALLTGGSVKCWGYNASGQLGLGDKKSRGTSASHMGDNLPFVLLTP